jgi:hypothetical protein
MFHSWLSVHWCKVPHSERAALFLLHNRWRGCDGEAWKSSFAGTVCETRTLKQRNGIRRFLFLSFECDTEIPNGLVWMSTLRVGATCFHFKLAICRKCSRYTQPFYWPRCWQKKPNKSAQLITNGFMYFLRSGHQWDKAKRDECSHGHQNRRHVKLGATFPSQTHTKTQTTFARRGQTMRLGDKKCAWQR